MPDTHDVEALWRLLGDVPDPEVPALSVVDLGIVRDVRLTPSGVEVDITPTYSGCPALLTIEQDIVAALERAGAGSVRVHTILQPAWTTDWMSEDARARLRRYGIAPPGPVTTGEELIPLLRHRATVACPFCGSLTTELRSAFGATACKALHYCNACAQAFEEFKAI